MWNTVFPGETMRGFLAKEIHLCCIAGKISYMLSRITNTEAAQLLP
jgi:hypothetical protein